MGHSEHILAMLDAVRCRSCGDPAVRGATVCLGCAMRHSFSRDDDRDLASA